MIVAVAVDVTADVVMSNCADVLPAETVTVAGTVADVLLLLSATGAPPVGAAVASVTVACEVAPALTVEGARIKELIDGPAARFNVALREKPYVAVIVADPAGALAVCVIPKTAVVVPAAMATVDGTLIAGFEHVSTTLTPPAGAEAPRMIVPLAD